MADARTLEELSTPSYWDARYARRLPEESAFEWFKSFSELQPLLQTHLPAPAGDGQRPHILHLGCGNSTVPLDLNRAGYRRQTCVDFSTVVIDLMKARYAELLPGVEWRVMDVRDMAAFEGPMFDVAIDKGTLDAMLFGSLWDPPEEVKVNVRRYMNEVARVLSPDGVFLYITYRQPHFMLPFLRLEGVWDIKVETLQAEQGAFEYFAYVIRKLNGADHSI